MPFTAEELRILRQKLPRGYSKVLAKKHRMTSGSIRNILSGISSNEDVVLSAIQLVEDRDRKTELAKAAISNLG